MNKVVFWLILFLFPFTSAAATDISATGAWSLVIGSKDLISGAGSDLTSSYVSSPSACALTISKAGHHKWQVSARRTGPSWPSSLTLYVRRTTDGTGKGEISGGTAFIPITAVDTTFFTGQRDRKDISCQYKVEGMSIAIPPGTYGLTVTYTVRD